MNSFYLPAVRIRGFRPFRDVLFRFNRLEVIIGANGSGKSSLFEFLKFLRDSCHHEIPPEIISDHQRRNIFHSPGPNRLFWNVQLDIQSKGPLFYQGEMEGGIGNVKVLFERIITKQSLDEKSPSGFTFLDFREGKGLVRDPEDGDFLRKEWNLDKEAQLGLGAITDASLTMLFSIREYFRNFRFFSGSRIANWKMRRPTAAHRYATLDEDCGNLNAVLYHMMTEHPESFEDLKSLIRFAIPGFKNIEVRACGTAGEVMTFWQEQDVEADLTFEDLSDGVLWFIALATLCVMPSPSPLICIDDPERGLHPRTLPILAGLFEKAAETTQVLLATHASYFLTQFDLENISLLKKTPAGSTYTSLRSSQAILAKLKQMESDELEQMYRADELEALF